MTTRPLARTLSVGEDDGPVDSLSQSLLVHGHAVDALDLVPEENVQTVVTSPPYWSLRDYEVDRQIGRDDSLEEYVSGIVDTFAKVRRVLAADGAVWLNVGDSYASGNRTYRAPDQKNRARAMAVRPPTPEGLKPKDRRSLASGAGPAGRRLVAAFRSGLVQRASGVRPSDEGPRDRVPPVEEPELRRRGCAGAERPAVADDPGNSHGTAKTIQRRRPSCGHGAGSALRTSRAGDFVLDAGSGTTLLAARGMDRRWVGVELKEKGERRLRES